VHGHAFLEEVWRFFLQRTVRPSHSHHPILDASCPEALNRTLTPTFHSRHVSLSPLTRKGAIPLMHDGEFRSTTMASKTPEVAYILQILAPC